MGKWGTEGDKEKSHAPERSWNLLQNMRSFLPCNSLFSNYTFQQFTNVLNMKAWFAWSLAKLIYAHTSKYYTIKLVYTEHAAHTSQYYTIKLVYIEHAGNRKNPTTSDERRVVSGGDANPPFTTCYMINCGIFCVLSIFSLIKTSLFSIS